MDDKHRIVAAVAVGILYQEAEKEAEEIRKKIRERRVRVGLRRQRDGLRRQRRDALLACLSTTCAVSLMCHTLFT